MDIAFSLIIAIIVVVFLYWACRRSPKYWYLGGIVPLIWIILNIISFISGEVNFAEDWKVIVFPTLMILMMWAEGQQSARKKETAKMKVKDI